MDLFNLKLANQLKQHLGRFSAEDEPSQLSALSKAYLDFYKLPLPETQWCVSLGTLNINQQSIFCASWRPNNAKATALIVHGYMDHLGLYKHLITFLLSQNIAVVCFDLSGHGLSAGEPGHINDFAEYTDVLETLIETCQQHFPAPLHGLGQSMGGAILLKHLINYSDISVYPFDTLNLFAPLLYPKAWTISRIFLPFIKPFRRSIKRVFRPSSYDLVFLDFLRHKDPLQPLTIPVTWLGAVDNWIKEFETSEGSDFPVNLIQGTADKTLDWQRNTGVFTDKLPNLHLCMIDHANHHLVNEIESLRCEIFNAIKL